MEIIFNHKQFIHICLSNTYKFVSWLIAIYASPIHSVRSHLWTYLDDIPKTVKGPWLLRGDFNAILHLFNKKMWLCLYISSLLPLQRLVL